MIRAMRRFAVVAAVTVVFGQSAMAAELQFPVTIGDSEALVKEKFGEPDQVGAWESQHEERLFYMRQGFEIDIDTLTQTVSLIDFHGTPRLEEWGMYAGQIAGGIGMSSTFDQVVQALGSDYANDEMDEGSSFRSFYWDLGPTYYFSIDFWVEDYKDDNGKTYPKGTIYQIKLFKRSSSANS